MGSAKADAITVSINANYRYDHNVNKPKIDRTPCGRFEYSKRSRSQFLEREDLRVVELVMLKVCDRYDDTLADSQALLDQPLRIDFVWMKCMYG